MPSNLPRLTLRLPQDTIDKIKAIAEKEHRSTNEQIHYLIEKCIETYETRESRTEQKSKLEQSSISRTG